jgi:hypothetical protein
MKRNPLALPRGLASSLYFSDLDWPVSQDVPRLFPWFAKLPTPSHYSKPGSGARKLPLPHDRPPPAVRFLRYLIATKKTGEQAMRVLGG